VRDGTPETFDHVPLVASVFDRYHATSELSEHVEEQRAASGGSVSASIAQSRGRRRLRARLASPRYLLRPGIPAAPRIAASATPRVLRVLRNEYADSVWCSALGLAAATEWRNALAPLPGDLRAAGAEPVRRP